MLTMNEKILRTFLIVLLGLYSIVLLSLPIGFLFFSHETYFLLNPLGLNYILFVFTQALMCWFAISDLRRFTLLVKLLIWVSAFFCIGTGYTLIFKNSTIISDTGAEILSLKNALVVTFLVNFVVSISLSVLLRAAERERYRLQYFSPLQYKTLAALAEVIIYGEDEVLSSDEIASNVDTYFVSFEAKSKWTMALVITGLYFYPLLSLKPPLPYIAPDVRLDFLKKRFYRDIEQRLIPEFWRVIAQGMIRIAKQMCYIGYYNDKKTFASVGYVPFSKRINKEERFKNTSPQKAKPLYVKSEKDINTDIVEGDVIIIGSGAAASILAKGLVESGRSVLMLERGNHEQPETFTENEMEMVSRLYQDGAIQAARDFRFTVFQGSCVGGSTVVNNAVCFKMPEEVIDKWNDQKGLNAGLKKSEVMKSMDDVWDMIGVEYMDPQKTKLNPGGALFTQGCKKLQLDISPSIVDSVNANISGCVGCGYCNIGCRYDRKLSMLVKILPEIQEKYGKKSLEIIAGCEAIKLSKKGKRIESVECRLKSGRKISVRGKTFVVSAGAISSSILLLKSNLGLTNAGKNLSFNVGSQITAAFPDKIDSYDGLQISHYLKINPNTGFVMESWFNPPMFQSTAMPGWFEDHYRNMRRYDHLACVGILVGSESNARVKVAGLTGREIDYTPTQKDFRKLLTGLELSGQIMFAAGADSVMPNTFKYFEYKNGTELKKIYDNVKDSSEITLGTGHPQGGNIISSTPESGVVSPEFKAFGYDNLFVCDASVFPSSVGVNPQLTVMGLANYAVQFIKDNR